MPCPVILMKYGQKMTYNVRSLSPYGDGFSLRLSAFHLWVCSQDWDFFGACNSQWKFIRNLEQFRSMVHGKLGFVIYIVIINFNLLLYESQTISEIRITLKLYNQYLKCQTCQCLELNIWTNKWTKTSDLINSGSEKSK